MNKRVPEASALREFFQEQWEHLQQLLEARKLKSLDQQEEKEKLTNAVESIVEGTDKRIRGIGGYQKQLRSSAHGLLDYIERLVAEMPPALVVDRTTVISNPLVNTLFYNKNEMYQLFSQSTEIQEFFNSSDNKDKHEVFALLFLNRIEKNIFGAEMNGETLLKDVQQTTIKFSGHQLIGSRATEEAARTVMKKTLFDSVIRYLKNQIIELRHSLSEDEKKDHINNPAQNINNPKVYLEMLVKQLSIPKRLIKLQDNMLRVSKMGIKLPLDSRILSNMVQLYEVEIGEERSRVVSLVRFPRNELLPFSSEGF